MDAERSSFGRFAGQRIELVGLQRGEVRAGAAFAWHALIQPSRQCFSGDSRLFRSRPPYRYQPKHRTVRGRNISVEQLTLNVRSIFSDDTGNQGGVQGNKDWRLMWWGEIWDYTVEGPYFWGGKGFGINLATDDGFQIRDGTLRSPHSSHMTVLARMGVPGALLWLALQASFAVSMVLSTIASRARGTPNEARFKTWLLAIWMAALVNASFDVYLEGPQGAIIFWSAFGAGMAAMRLDRMSLAKRDEVPTDVGSRGAIGAHTASE